MAKPHSLAGLMFEADCCEKKFISQKMAWECAFYHNVFTIVIK